MYRFNKRLYWPPEASTARRECNLSKTAAGGVRLGVSHILYFEGREFVDDGTHIERYGEFIRRRHELDAALEAYEQEKREAEENHRKEQERLQYAKRYVTLLNQCRGFRLVLSKNPSDKTMLASIEIFFVTYGHLSDIRERREFFRGFLFIAQSRYTKFSDADRRKMYKVFGLDAEPIRDLDNEYFSFKKNK